MSAILESEFLAAARMLAAPAAVRAVVASSLVGTWQNLNKATQNPVKIVISASGVGLMLEAFSSCTHPEPCDWGTTSGATYALGSAGGAAGAFSALFTLASSQILLLGHLHGRYLFIETFTQFTDGSERANHYASDTMAR